MHSNPAFRKTSDSENIAFAHHRGFGLLVVSGDGSPLLSHVPFRLSENGETAELHLARSNPIVRSGIAESPVTLVVSGPDSYVSPDWYGQDEQVPTWNYVAIHINGRLQRRPDTELRASIDNLAAHFEQKLTPKPAWKSNKMSADALAKLMRIIVPYRIHVDNIDGTWKLNQNKTDDVIEGASDHIRTEGIGHDLQRLSELMLNPPS